MQHKIYKKVVLVILDGFGVASYSHGNAIGLANPEALNNIVSQFPSLTLQASGPLVGLPWGEMGNSEVGHLNIGAGRIVGQDLPRITTAIQSGEFFKNPVFLEAIEHVKKYHSRLHLAGLVSPGGIHSLDEHLYALLALPKSTGQTESFVHMFTDGRDTAEKVALDSVRKLKDKIKEIGINARIATLAGRFYAMDRGAHWDQTEMTYQAMVNGVGAAAYTAEDCIFDNYNQGIFDEMISPTVMVDADDKTGSKLPVAKIQDNDAVIFFNFRPDRALQLVQAFVQPEVMKIPSRHVNLQNVYLATMTEYFTGLPVHVAFPSISLKNNLAEVISNAHLTQFHIAESEKYAHVTSFFNGGVSQALPGEERIIVTSPNNTQNYSDHPDMSAIQLTDILIDKIVHTEHNFYVANFANPDMVGHTGNLAATIKAIKFIDRFLEKIMESTLLVDAGLIITSDHGNAEQMINLRTGEIDKDHTTNPVPFILVCNLNSILRGRTKIIVIVGQRFPTGVISDIAPTVLDLFGLPKPSEMTGVNLIDIMVEEGQIV